MPRCAFATALAAVAVVASSVAAPAARAQAVRPFPANALRGTLQVTQPPEVLLNGQPARLSPGSRIRGQNNLQVLSGALVGQPLLVHYTSDGSGNVHLVWILTPDEAARKPWPTTPEQAAAWQFDPASQTWSKP